METSRFEYNFANSIRYRILINTKKIQFWIELLCSYNMIWNEQFISRHQCIAFTNSKNSKNNTLINISILRNTNCSFDHKFFRENGDSTLKNRNHWTIWNNGIDLVINKRHGSLNPTTREFFVLKFCTVEWNRRRFSVKHHYLGINQFWTEWNIFHTSFVRYFFTFESCQLFEWINQKKNYYRDYSYCMEALKWLELWIH